MPDIDDLEGEVYMYADDTTLYAIGGKHSEQDFRQTFITNGAAKID